MSSSGACVQGYAEGEGVLQVMHGGQAATRCDGQPCPGKYVLRISFD